MGASEGEAGIVFHEFPRFPAERGALSCTPDLRLRSSSFALTLDQAQLRAEPGQPSIAKACANRDDAPPSE